MSAKDTSTNAAEAEGNINSSSQLSSPSPGEISRAIDELQDLGLEVPPAVKRAERTLSKCEKRLASCISSIQEVEKDLAGIGKHLKIFTAALMKTRPCVDCLAYRDILERARRIIVDAGTMLELEGSSVIVTYGKSFRLCVNKDGRLVWINFRMALELATKARRIASRRVRKDSAGKEDQPVAKQVLDVSVMQPSQGSRNKANVSSMDHDKAMAEAMAATFETSENAKLDDQLNQTQNFLDDLRAMLKRKHDTVQSISQLIEKDCGKLQEYLNDVHRDLSLLFALHHTMSEGVLFPLDEESCKRLLELLSQSKDTIAGNAASLVASSPPHAALPSGQTLPEHAAILFKEIPNDVYLEELEVARPSASSSSAGKILGECASKNIRTTEASIQSILGELDKQKHRQGQLARDADLLNAAIRLIESPDHLRTILDGLNVFRQEGNGHAHPASVESERRFEALEAALGAFRNDKAL